MLIKILGANSALDGLNTSFFFRDDSGRGVLVDCGFTVYPELNKLGMLNDVDVVLISHLHGDHVGSLPTLLGLRKGKGHTVIVGGADISELIKTMENKEDLSIPLSNDDPLNVKYVDTNHIVGVMPNKAMFIANKILYSGDSKESLLDTDYAKQAQIIIHDVALNRPVFVKLEELNQASPEVKSKTWLVNIPTEEAEEITRLAAEMGFAGVCHAGQEIEI